jgi:hypothetical protein
MKDEYCPIMNCAAISTKWKDSSNDSPKLTYLLICTAVELACGSRKKQKLSGLGYKPKLEDASFDRSWIKIVDQLELEKLSNGFISLPENDNYVNGKSVCLKCYHWCYIVKMELFLVLGPSRQSGQIPNKIKYLLKANRTRNSYAATSKYSTPENFVMGE